MQTVEMAARIDAPADLAWSIVGDFGSSALTRGYVARVETRGHGIGALRVYHLASHLGGGHVIERLERLDNHDRVIEYSMVDNGPLQWAEYRGHISVGAAGPDACVVLVRTQFCPIDPDDADYAAMSRSNIGMYLDNVRAAVAEALERAIESA